LGVVTSSNKKLIIQQKASKKFKAYVVEIKWKINYINLFSMVY